MIRKYRMVVMICMLFCLLPSIPVAADSFSDRDPWESWNRKVFLFNDSVDAFVFRPVSKAYLWVMPNYLQARLTGAFMNLGEVRNLVNDTLQLKFKSAGIDLSRLIINSTVGLLGMYDVAAHWGLARSDEDLGQTLASWGLPSGPYLVMPLAGPSTVRDFSSRVGDFWLDPMTYGTERSLADKVTIARFIELRARFLSVEDLTAGDQYSFIRNAYLQRRDFLINDGALPLDDWGDDWADEWDDDLDAEGIDE